MYGRHMLEDFMKRWICGLLVVWMINGFLFSEEPLRKEMSLKEAIVFALKNNLDLQVEMTNTEYYWNALKINKSIFIPSFEVSANTSEINYPSTSAFAGADITKNSRSSLDFKLSQTMALGGILEVSLENSRFETNSIYNTINPSLTTVMTFSLSQPLLKNFGMLSTKKDIYIAANDYKKFKHQLKQSIIDLVFSVEEAYWNLVYAYQNLEATRMSLQRSKDLLRQNEIKVKVGTAAKIDILEAQAEVASYESRLIQAEQTIQTTEENLKKILNMTKTRETLIPSDTPKVTRIDTNFNGFLMEALQKRPDIEKARLDLKNHKLDVRYYRNQMLPDLQLVASYYTTGQGGDQLLFDIHPFYGGQITGVIEKDIWETLKDNVANLYQNYSIGLSLSLPLSRSREKAQLAQARINLRKALLELKNVENTIYSEVKEVLKELETNLKLVEANRIALELEAQKLRAEEKKLSVGLSTNFQVLNFQRDFANAKTNSLKSIIDYNLTVAKLNRTLVRTFKVYRIKFADFLKNQN